MIINNLLMQDTATPSSDHRTSLTFSEPRASSMSRPRILTLFDGTQVVYQDNPQGSTAPPSNNSQYDTGNNVQATGAELVDDTQAAQNAASEQESKKRKRISDHHNRLRPSTSLRSPPSKSPETQEKSSNIKPVRSSIVRKMQMHLANLNIEGAGPKFPNNLTQAHGLSKDGDHVRALRGGTQQLSSKSSSRRVKKTTKKTAEQLAEERAVSLRIDSSLNQIGL